MIKLAKLPNRTPVKVTISVSPDLNEALVDYAALYADAYGQTEQICDLVPAMIAGFLDSDRTFAKTRKQTRQGS